MHFMEIPEYLSTYYIRPLQKWWNILLLHLSEILELTFWFSECLCVRERDAMKRWRRVHIFSIDKALETKTGIISGKFSSLLGSLWTCSHNIYSTTLYWFLSMCQASSFENRNIKVGITSHFPYTKIWKVQASWQHQLIKSTAIFYIHPHHLHFGRSHKFEKHT